MSNYLKPLEASVELIKLERNIERRNIMAVNFYDVKYALIAYQCPYENTD